MAEEANTQIAEIEEMILQAIYNYFSKDLWNIVQSDIESQAYHIQALLADELDSCKEKGNKYAKTQIKEIQDIYKQDNLKVKKPQINKEK